MRIIAIKKRNFLERLFTINHWKVTAEDAEGNIKTYNCWGNTDSFEVNSILYDLRGKIETEQKRKQFEKDLKDLVGKDLRK